MKRIWRVATVRANDARSRRTRALPPRATRCLSHRRGTRREQGRGFVTTRAGQPYTAGSWLVCAGGEDEFVAAWAGVPAWSLRHAPGAESFVLIRHAADPLRFLSFGAWTDTDAVTSWRGLDEFRERLGRGGALCEEFEGHDSADAS